MNTGCILYAEDDPNDVFFMQQAFAEAGIPNPLQIVNDGQTAMDYLAGVGVFADRRRYPLPCLVLLDLKLPDKTGLEVLAWIRAQPVLLGLPVIMFTASSHPVDVEQACRLGANSFTIKPLFNEDRLKYVRALQAYWLTFHTPPPHRNARRIIFRPLNHETKLQLASMAGPQSWRREDNQRLLDFLPLRFGRGR